MFTFQEAYGHLPKSLWTLIKKSNVSPSDYLLLQLNFCEDWDRIADFIKANLNNGSFIYPLSGMS